MPKAPVILHFDHLQSFIFRTLSVSNVLDMNTPTPDIFKEKTYECTAFITRRDDGNGKEQREEMGRWLMSPYVRDYLILWMPQPSRFLTQGTDYKIVIKHITGWWPWRKEVELFRVGNISISAGVGEEDQVIRIQ